MQPMVYITGAEESVYEVETTYSSGNSLVLLGLMVSQ